MIPRNGSQSGPAYQEGVDSPVALEQKAHMYSHIVGVSGDLDHEEDEPDMWGDMDEDLAFEDDEKDGPDKVPENQSKVPDEDLNELEAESQVKPQVESHTVPEAEPEVEPETEPQAEPEIEPETEPEAKAEVEQQEIVKEETGHNVSSQPHTVEDDFDDFDNEITKGISVAAKSLEASASEAEPEAEVQDSKQDESNERDLNPTESAVDVASEAQPEIPIKDELNKPADSIEQPEEDSIHERINSHKDLEGVEQPQNSISKELEQAKEHSVAAAEPVNGNNLAQFTQLTSTISTLTSQLAQATQERDEIQQSYDTLLSKLSSMKTIFSKMKESEIELEEKTELVETLTKQNQELKSKLEKVSHDKSQEDELVSQLRESNNDLNNECERLSDTLTKSRREYQATIDELSDEKYNFENQNSKLSKKINELKMELNELNILQNELELDNKNQAATIEELKSVNAQKDHELEERNKIIEDLRLVILENQQATEKITSDLKQEIESLKEKVSKVDHDNETLLTEINSKKQEIDNLNNQLKEIDELKTDINTKQLLIGKLRHEAIILNEHLTKALTMIKQGSGDGSNKTIDRELISNVILSFLQFSRGDTKKFEALQLISALLQWDPEQKVAAGLQSKGSGGGKVDKTGPDGQQQRQSFVSLWTDFLEKESMGG